MQLRTHLEKPVAVEHLVFIRVGFGLLMLWEVARFLYHDWVGELWIRTSFLFKYPGFEWVQPWSPTLLYVHWSLLGLLAFFITIGLFYRVATVLFLIGFTYFFLLDASYYLNHLYLVCLITVMLTLVPANRAFSIDSRLFPHIKSRDVPFWSVLLFRFQMVVVYFYGGIAKLDPDWLGLKTMPLWLAEKKDYPVIGVLYGQPWANVFFSYGGLLFDLLVPFLLCLKRTRTYTIVVVVLFHVSNQIMFNIGIFPMLSILLSLLFLPSEMFRKAFQKLGLHSSDAQVSVPSPLKGFSLGLLSCFCVLQLLIPFRHWLYPGKVNWNEQGQFFSWRMMARDKRSNGHFIVRNPETREVMIALPQDYLHTLQAWVMGQQPDFIHQFALFLNQAARTGGFDAEVYSQIQVSLNGRPYQYLVDPNLDLAHLPKSFFSSRKITLPLNL